MTDVIRVATFNASLNRNSEGQLITDLATPDNAQAKAVAEIIQRTDADVILINEFDYDAAGEATRLFQDNYLSVSQNGAVPVTYAYVFQAPSNTGIPSGFDLDNNGSVGGGNDAFGFGNFPGQFGMLVLSKLPIDQENVRTFQNFLWKDMPGALLPDDPATPEPKDWYSPKELDVFRLSSKSHWDIPVEVGGEIVHILAAHPTPPVFDGPEDRNGTRNHDEIRFWADYVTPDQGDYIYDDAGGSGGLGSNERFVIVGDYNADPLDGDSTDDAILQLLDNGLIDDSLKPTSEGGPQQSTLQGGANATHIGDPAFDTADFADTTPGNLRVDYVLPSEHGLRPVDAAVFWPLNTNRLFPLVGTFDPTLRGGFPSSDHRVVSADLEIVSDGRAAVSGLEFLGQVTLATGFEFMGTVVGGLSGLTYDAAGDRYFAISDDRSQINPARFYTLTIDLADGSLDDGDVQFTDVTTLLDASGMPYAEFSLDPEGIALVDAGTLFISSEGDVTRDIDPFVDAFELTGQQLASLPVPDKFLPDGSSGIRNNLAFESLTVSPDGRFLYTATENALVQDGAAAGVDDGSPSRILVFDLATGQPVKELLYETDPVADEPVPAGSFATNGLVELLALDNSGTLLALERSFSNGVGNSVKLYQVLTQGAADIENFGAVAHFEVDPPVTKSLLFDFADLGITLDNLEGLAFGPKLADGRQSLIVVSDNNFSATQFTQVLAFAVDLDAFASAAPTVETPDVIRFGDPAMPDETMEADPDDPAIWVHPTDPSKSLVITTEKNTGIIVYDLAGVEVQAITPEGVRYNNVDLVYGFPLGGEAVDLAVASDRGNDTLAIFAIDPDTGELTDVTVPALADPAFSVFGEDDGEQTAYGLATYTSLVDGTDYVFVTQRDGDKVAQLKLTDDGAGGVTAEVVRLLQLPVPTGDSEDSQAEGMVVDRELGLLYVALEGETGIVRFSAEPAGGDAFTVVQPVGASYLTPDIEGLTIYYGPDGTGYLLASSQGDHTFAVFAREGTNDYLGSFVVGPEGGIDSAEESDGADVVNVPLGPDFPFGLLVVQDGSNEDQVVFQEPDGDEIQNFNANFKYVPWQNVAAALPRPLDIDTTRYDPRAPQAQSLANGVASGDTTQTTTVLWARSTLPGTVRFEVSDDPTFATIVETVTADVTAVDVPAKVQVQGLSPGTDYYYRVTDAGGDEATGRFATAAEAGTFAGLTFGVSGDWRGELAPYPAIANVAEAALDFFVLHGDTVYADVPSPAVLEDDGNRKDQAETIAEYRAKHAEVYGSRFGENVWAEIRASTSMLATIDDHEVTNDFAGGAPAASDDRFAETEGLVNDTALYENGLQAFQDWNPLEDRFYGDTGDDRTAGERQLYRFNTYGSDAATIVLDARSFRDEELDSPNLTNPADVARFLAQSFDPSRTMLGAAQLKDLKADLAAAQGAGITWKFVMVPEPIQNLSPLAAQDRFEGYAAERTEILKFIDDNRISNVVFVAADIHGTVVNNLTYQEQAFGPQIATSAFEVTTGSVAYDAPYAQTVADLAAGVGLITPEQKAFFDSLPIAPDADDVPNDKDDFIKVLTNDVLADFGYDPIGLNNNLAIAQGLIDATLLQGDYQAAATYGWSQFDIDPDTLQLTVTTWGIEPYTEAELLADPDAILARSPAVVSRFAVNPGNGAITGTDGPNSLRGTSGDDLILGLGGDDTVNGGSGSDVLYGGDGNDNLYGSSEDDIVWAGAGEDHVLGGSHHDRIDGGDGNDTLDGGSGNDDVSGGNGDDVLKGGSGKDVLTGGAGDDTLTGGSGNDIFVVAFGDGTDTVTDFRPGSDLIGLEGGLSVDYLDLTPGGGGTTIIAVDGDVLAIVATTTGAILGADDFFAFA